MNFEFMLENMCLNVLFVLDVVLDVVLMLGGDVLCDGFEFEVLKDLRIDWGVIARCDSRDARRRRDIDVLESVFEVCV